jgi:hypothetical protein
MTNRDGIPPPMTERNVKTLPVDDFTVKFADLSDADKIERLRRDLSGWIQASARLRDEVEQLKTRFQAHEHGGDGKATIPANLRERSDGACGAWNKLA